MKKLSDRRWFAAFLLPGLLLFITACQSDLTSPTVVIPDTPVVLADTPQAVVSASVPTLAPLARGALENLEYQGIYEQVVKLADGEFVGTPFQEGGASRPTLTLQGVTDGDLNQDGRADALVLLAENSGGSGIFMYLAAVLDENGKSVNTSTILLGDRVRIQSIRLVDGKIVVAMLTHAPEDPLCCPTQAEEKTYVVDAGRIVPLVNQ